MKLQAKIKNKYLKQILEGKKNVEYRQIESIVFVDEQGNEYEFKVNKIFNIPQDTYILTINDLRMLYPDVPWKDNMLTIGIVLGERIK